MEELEIMKKIICVILCLVVLVFIFASCGNSLPSGKASRITLIDGWEIHDATFKYVNENTIKIVRNEDNQVFYIPDSSVKTIWVAD